MEARPLAQLAVPGLEGLGRGRVLDDGVDPGPDLVHLLVVAGPEGGLDELGGELAAGADLGHDAVADALGDVGPAVLDQVLVGEAPRLEGGEVAQPPLLPARLELLEPLGVDVVVVAHVDGRRRALEHEGRTGVAGQVGDALHGGGTGADDADALVGQLRHGLAVGRAARVVVVPSAGVEGVAAEGLDAGDARQLGPVQRAGAHGHEPGPDGVAPVGVHDPARAGLVPLEPLDRGRQQGVVVEPEGGGDALGLAVDLGGRHVLLGGDVAGLLEQRQVDHGRRVAHGPGVAVPVPGTTDVAAALDEHHVVDPGLGQPGTGAQPGEAAADDGHVDLVVARLALGGLDVGIVEEVGVPAGGLDVLGPAVGPEALVALGPVLGPEVRAVRRCAGGAHRHPPGRSGPRPATRPGRCHIVARPVQSIHDGRCDTRHRRTRGMAGHRRGRDPHR